jgi:hypothetical protein
MLHLNPNNRKSIKPHCFLHEILLKVVMKEQRGVPEIKGNPMAQEQAQHMPVQPEVVVEFHSI